MKSKEYYEYKATIMRKFLEKAGTSFYQDSPQDRQRSTLKQPPNHYSDQHVKKRPSFYDAFGRESSQSFSTEVDSASDARSSYCAANSRAAGSSKDSVSAYKKYLARAKNSVADPPPKKAPAYSDVSHTVQAKKDPSMPQGAIKITGKQPLSCLSITDKIFFYANSKSLRTCDDYTVLNIDTAYNYEGYNNDFGPFTLNYVHKFCC